MEDLDQLKEQLEAAPQVKRGRGRPKSGGVSTNTSTSKIAEQAAKYNPEEDTRTIINDPLLLPYKIIVTAYSYNVVDAVRPEGAIADAPYAYCSTLDSALLRVTRLKTTKNKTYTALKDYINDFRGIINGLKESVK